MTIDEAIAFGRKRLGLIRGSYASFMTLSLEALEKQIPKKPDLEGDGYADGEMVYDIWICPACGEKFEIEYDQDDYCPNCGQHIDWSKEREEQEHEKNT